jgi:hypothetical protein
MQSKHGEHAAGFSFFGAIGVVTTQITSSADAGVVDLANTERQALLDDFGSEIDFVMRRANARAELYDQVRGIGAKVFNHLFDCVCHDAELGAFASGMHEANRGHFWIDNVNSATICDVNAQRDAGLIGDDGVATGKFATINSAGDSGHYSVVDDCDFVSVDLLGGEQRPVAKAGCVANFVMRCIEALQHIGFIMGDGDAGNSVRENMMNDANRAQRRKLFEEQVHYSVDDLTSKIPSHCHPERSEGSQIDFC